MGERRDDSWYAVRCVFATGWPPDRTPSMTPTYEERITLWLAASPDDAIRRAEEEAHAYAAAIEEVPDIYLGLAQCYHLTDEPGDGTEVFSLLRDSTLGPEEYLDTFFDTGAEHQADGE